MLSIPWFPANIAGQTMLCIYIYLSVMCIFLTGWGQPSLVIVVVFSGPFVVSSTDAAGGQASGRCLCTCLSESSWVRSSPPLLSFSHPIKTAQRAGQPLKHRVSRDFRKVKFLFTMLQINENVCLICDIFNRW